ncbi:MAG: GNAT family N-acetyltransferase [Bacteroidetes bacterium]|nr:GNAT family N-acetyltransferase [Bacteroidota bacterium]MBS1974063.1 GNAT family N-acetyltransferase [Bacteroidota bacterium]
MEIATAGLQDVPELLGLINGAYRGEGAKKGWTTEADLLDGTRTDSALLEKLISDVNGTILKFVDDQNRIIGCVNLQKHGLKLYLGMLTVSPELQGGGIGKKMLAAAIDYASQHQCYAIYMTVISVRHELIAWYERHGYKKTGEKKPFPVGPAFGIQKQPLEMVVMEREVQ